MQKEQKCTKNQVTQVTQVTPQLQNIISSTLQANGIPKAPPATPWQTQLDVIQKRKKYELECLLRVVLLKLSTYEDEFRESYTEMAHNEMSRLQQILTGSLSPQAATG